MICGNAGYTSQDIQRVRTKTGYLQWLRDNLPLLNIFAASQAEVDAGIINNKYVSPLTLAGSLCCSGGGLFDIDGGNAYSVYPPPNAMDGGGA